MMHDSQFTMHNYLKKIISLKSFPKLCIVHCALCIALTACHTTKKVSEVPLPVKLKGENVIQLFDSVLTHQFNYTSLTAKANVQYLPAQSEAQSFDATLRLLKDSAIWLSVTPLLGIEVARVLITRDSLRILDRFHKTYMVRDYTFLEDLLKTKINFEIIQAVIVGNYFPYLKNEKLRSVYEDSTFLILSTLTKHQAKRVMEDKDVNKPIVQDFWIDGNYKIRKSLITDDKLDRTLQADYTNFMNLNEANAAQPPKLFPRNIEVSVVASPPLKIKVIYEKVTEEPTTLPFTVPEKYERK